MHNFSYVYEQKQSPEIFGKKGVLKNVAIFKGKYVFESLFNKVAGLKQSFMQIYLSG